MGGPEQQTPEIQLPEVHGQEPPPPQREPPTPANKRGPAVPVSIQRTLVIVFVLVCFELGVMLILLPWKEIWTQNSMLVSYPNLHLWLNRPFVRGVVSGVGILDLWIGLSAAIHYRDRR